MKKDFKIARKPGQPTTSEKASAPTTIESPAPTVPSNATSEPVSPPLPKSPVVKVEPAPPVELGPTTRKTIEVPQGYFYQVKLRALQRRMLEKELWAEILQEYFQNHP